MFTLHRILAILYAAVGAIEEPRLFHGPSNASEGAGSGHVAGRRRLAGWTVVCAPIFGNTCRVCSEVRQPVPALPSAHFGAKGGEVAIRGTRLRAFVRSTAFSCWRGQLIRSAPWSFKCLSARPDPRGNWFAHLVARSLSPFLDSDPLSPNREQQQPPAPLAASPRSAGRLHRPVSCIRGAHGEG